MGVQVQYVEKIVMRSSVLLVFDDIKKQTMSFMNVVQWKNHFLGNFLPDQKVNEQNDKQ